MDNNAGVSGTAFNVLIGEIRSEKACLRMIFGLQLRLRNGSGNAGRGGRSGAGGSTFRVATRLKGGGAWEVTSSDPY